MAFEILGEIPLSENIREMHPVTPEMVEVKKRRDQEIRDIFLKKSDKMLLIIGPCSAHNEDAVCEYAGVSRGFRTK